VGWATGAGSGAAAGEETGGEETGGEETGGEETGGAGCAPCASAGPASQQHNRAVTIREPGLVMAFSVILIGDA
jgi:energy-converting hydrogenase Eha subunit B